MAHKSIDMSSNYDQEWIEDGKVYRSYEDGSVRQVGIQNDDWTISYFGNPISITDNRFRSDWNNRQYENYRNRLNNVQNTQQPFDFEASLIQNSHKVLRSAGDFLKEVQQGQQNGELFQSYRLHNNSGYYEDKYLDNSNVLTGRAKQNLLESALRSTSISEAIKRGETVFLKQTFTVYMDYELGEEQKKVKYQTRYFMIHKGDDGKGASYFRQEGIINQDGDMPFAVGRLAHGIFDRYDPNYGIVEKIPVDVHPVHMPIDTEIPKPNPIKVSPLPQLFKSQSQVPPNIRVNVRRALPITFLQNSDAIDNRNNVTNKILGEIAKNLKENPTLIVHIIGNSNNKDPRGVHTPTGNTIRGNKNNDSTIGELMIARARSIERILINEYKVNPDQIRVQIGKTGTSQTTEFIYEIRK